MKRILLCFLFATTANAAEYKVETVPESLQKEWKLSPFYKKVVLTKDFPIISSDKVSDYGLKEAAYLVDQLLAGRDDVRMAMVKNKVRLSIMSPTEFTLDVPEHSDLKPAAYWNKRARGLGATKSRPAVSAGEENILQFPGDPYSTENILIHEFGHAIHQMGLVEVDRDFQKKLQAAYDEAKREGLWKGTYAISNSGEYWAEGLQSWFHCNRTNDSQHNHVNSRDEVKKYDPRLAKLLEEAFPKNDWIYTPPTKRKEPDHLKGYDRSKAPKFAWPEQISKDYDEYQKKNKKN
jgi:hypothetical protein